MSIGDWKATKLYNQTKHPNYVKGFLGHKSLKNTEIYINIENTLFELESSKNLRKSKNCLKYASSTSAKKTT